ncbi:MAG: epoxide hydrolase, partial [Leifsonia sp.]
MNIQPYSISIPDADLADLRDRLARTRWPDDLVSDWSRGVPVSYARKLVERWRDFDWRAQEARLNRYPQVIAEVDGQPIHVVHVTSAAPDAVPLLLCHGYPTSFVEFTALIDALVEPTEGGPAFHVVIPSIPGLGFSTPLTSTGWDIPRIAGAYDQIMQALGYERYAVFGGDVGAGILEELCIEAGE